jgi:hypothetical protein
MAHKGKSFFGPFLKNKVPMLLKRPPTFFLQEAHSFDSKTSTRPMYNVSCKGCFQRHQGQGVQKVALQDYPPVPYVPEEDPVQETVSLLKSDQSLKTIIRVDEELPLPIWHCRSARLFSCM